MTALVQRLFVYGDVVQFAPSAGDNLAGTLGIVMGGSGGLGRETYTVECVQLGRGARFDAVPAQVLRFVGRAEFILSAGRWVPIVGPS